jgi:cytochrome c-type biogenesis protein
VGRHHRPIQIFGGVMLILVGLLLLTGVWEDLTRWLQAELVSGFTVPI